MDLQWYLFSLRNTYLTAAIILFFTYLFLPFPLSSFSSFFYFIISALFFSPYNLSSLHYTVQVIGLGQNRTFIASETSAFSKYTKNYIAMKVREVLPLVIILEELCYIANAVMLCHCYVNSSFACLSTYLHLIYDQLLTETE